MPNRCRCSQLCRRQRDPGEQWKRSRRVLAGVDGDMEYPFCSMLVDQLVLQVQYM
jgi:hypothetical protein